MAIDVKTALAQERARMASEAEQHQKYAERAAQTVDDILRRLQDFRGSLAASLIVKPPSTIHMPFTIQIMSKGFDVEERFFERKVTPRLSTFLKITVAPSDPPTLKLWIEPEAKYRGLGYEILITNEIDELIQEMIPYIAREQEFFAEQMRKLKLSPVIDQLWDVTYYHWPIQT